MGNGSKWNKNLAVFLCVGGDLMACICPNGALSYLLTKNIFFIAECDFMSECILVVVWLMALCAQSGDKGTDLF